MSGGGSNPPASSQTQSPLSWTGSDQAMPGVQGIGSQAGSPSSQQSFQLPIPNFTPQSSQSSTAQPQSSYAPMAQINPSAPFLDVFVVIVPLSFLPPSISTSIESEIAIIFLPSA